MPSCVHSDPLSDQAIMASAIGCNGNLHRFDFMKLPHEIQNRVVENLDNKTMTLEQASNYISEHGYSLSHESVRRYYNALLTQRRNFQTQHTFLWMMQTFQDSPLDDVLKNFLIYLTSLAIQSVINGETKIKDIDMARILTVMPTAVMEGMQAMRRMKQGADDEVDCTPPHVREAIRRLYGIQLRSADPPLSISEELDRRSAAT